MASVRSVSDERPDRNAWLYVWALAVGLPGYVIVHYAEPTALDVFGRFLVVIGILPVVIFELLALVTLPYFAARHFNPGPERKRQRALDKVEQRRIAARRSLAEAARERQAK